MKLIFPVGVNLNTQGIYKLTFSNGYFYFGSTNNFKQRFSCFKHVLFNPEKLHNIKMQKCLVGCSEITFEILQVVEDVSLLREIETEFIRQFIGNPLLINRAFDAHSNKGIRWTQEEKAKISKGNKGNGRPSKPKVQKIVTYGKGRKLSTESLSNFQSKRAAWRKSINYIPPKISAQAKIVIQFDLNGNKLKEFPAISFAANHIGSRKKTFTSSVKSSKKGYYKGYIWKIA